MRVRVRVPDVGVWAIDRVQSGATESEAQLPFVWRGRATFSGEEEGEGGHGEGRREEKREDATGQEGWVDTRGLLSKIVDVFMKEPMDSLYRFWLASCVEAFLRGGRCGLLRSSSSLRGSCFFVFFSTFRAAAPVLCWYGFVHAAAVGGTCLASYKVVFLVTVWS